MRRLVLLEEVERSVRLQLHVDIEVGRRLSVPGGQVPFAHNARGDRRTVVFRASDKEYEQRGCEQVINILFIDRLCAIVCYNQPPFSAPFRGQ